MKKIKLGLVAILSGCLAGCMTEKHDLTSINKDWNSLIRASHIYPIYPLSQDIQPGDVFLTDTGIEDTSAWEKSGYVRFDHHIARLYPSDYAKFYERSFDYGVDQLPKRWLDLHSWDTAPAAAFPSYSFTVKQGGGANVALPISGIPVALGLMGARSASGYVTIGDSHTYGIDEISLTKQVKEFADNHSDDIARCIDLNGTNSTTRFYLQVVTRVYTTKRVSVSMVNDASAGVSVSGGAPKDVILPNSPAADPAATYSNLTAAVNANLSSLIPAAGAVLPGGTLKFTSVSSRSVSMDETFPQPLVIGYIGFSWQLIVRPQAGAAEGQPQYSVQVDPAGPMTVNQFLNRK